MLHLMLQLFFQKLKQKLPIFNISWKNGVYSLPKNIQPVMKKMVIEVMMG